MKEIIREWLDKADEDMRICEELMNNEEFADAIAFHAQQAAEKYLKALWEFFDLEIIKAHDLYFLKEELVKKTESIDELSDEELSFLTQFAVDFRYPGEKATMEEARKAHKIASRVKDVTMEILEG